MLEKRRPPVDGRRQVRWALSASSDSTDFRDVMASGVKEPSSSAYDFAWRKKNGWRHFSKTKWKSEIHGTVDLTTDCRDIFSGWRSRATIAGSLLAELLLRWTSTLTSQCCSMLATADDNPSTVEVSVTDGRGRPCALWFWSEWREAPWAGDETLSHWDSLAFNTCSSISSKSLPSNKNMVIVSGGASNFEWEQGGFWGGQTCLLGCLCGVPYACLVAVPQQIRWCQT